MLFCEIKEKDLKGEKMGFFAFFQNALASVQKWNEVVNIFNTFYNSSGRQPAGEGRLVKCKLKKSCNVYEIIKFMENILEFLLKTINNTTHKGLLCIILFWMQKSSAVLYLILMEYI